LERGHVLIRRTLKVHREQHRPHDYPCDARGNVLGDFDALLTPELFDLGIVGLDLGGDHCAIAVLILLLDRCDGRGVTAGAGGAKHGKR
jgi:hypothetical protein